MFVYSGGRNPCSFPCVYKYVEVPSVFHVLLIILTKLPVLPSRFPDTEGRMKRTRTMGGRERERERESDRDRDRGGERESEGERERREREGKL